MKNLILLLITVMTSASFAADVPEGFVLGHAENTQPMSTSCEVLKNRILFTYKRRAEVSLLLDKALNRKKTMTQDEVKELSLLVAGTQWQKEERTVKSVKFNVVWNLDMLLPEWREEMAKNYVQAPKRIRFAGLEWEDPNGILPDEINYEFTRTESGDLLTLAMNLTPVDACFGDQTVDFSFKLPSLGLNLHGEWNF